MRLLIIILIVLILGALFIAQKQDTSFKDVNSISGFTSVYIKWIIQVGNNVKEVGLFAYNLKWLPKADQEAEKDKIKKIENNINESNITE